MEKFFNIAGPCRADLHYMLEPLQRLAGVHDLVEGQHYFALYAPRQSGKTTYLYALMQQLNRKGRYTALVVNIQVAADARDSREAMRMVAAAIYRQATTWLLEPEWPARINENDMEFDSLQDYLADWCRHNRKSIVLFIDEVDVLPAEFLLMLLRQLRAGFETRPKNFPQSIVLVGLRDVQEYQVYTAQDTHHQSFAGSPFNVKSVALLMREFSFDEMSALLAQHEYATGQCFDEEVKQEMYHLTAGQPWLINALAHQIIVGLLGSDYDKKILLKHVSLAKTQLMQRCDTHLHSLLSRLREPPVKLVIESIINGETPDFTKLNEALAYVRSLGIVARTPPIRFSNPIYQEMTLRSLSLAFQEALSAEIVKPTNYLNLQGGLNMDLLLERFQRFYRRHAEIWLSRYDFKESGRQLLFFAFILRTLDGTASIEWEVAVGSNRCHMRIDYADRPIALTLKLRHDNYAREEGLEQAESYIKSLSIESGYLILFDVFWEERIYREEIQQNDVLIKLLGM